MKKAHELRGKSASELEQELKDLLKEQFNLRMQSSGGAQLGDASKIRKVRRDIARVKTVMREQDK